MERIVDARGLSCPFPVVNTKKAIAEIDSGLLIVIVDNGDARDNVVRLAKSLGYPAEVDQKEDGFYVKIIKDINCANQPEGRDLVILITGSTLGRGSEELGAILMKSFIFTLSETEPLPKSIIFINSGVFLTCEGSPVLEQLVELEKKGTEILSCGTCLDYFHLKDKLIRGSISNMYTIVEKLFNNKAITL
ncbi:MAG: sulfurtransferase-like selenium metabolism protein YedF [Bacillota bacterium]